MKHLFTIRTFFSFVVLLLAFTAGAQSFSANWSGFSGGAPYAADVTGDADSGDGLGSAGVSLSTSGGNLSTSGWPLSAITPGDYLQFCTYITEDKVIGHGKTLTFSFTQFNQGGENGDGSGDDVPAYTAQVYLGLPALTLQTTVSGSTATASPISFTYTTPGSGPYAIYVCLRIYGYATGSNQNWSFSDVSISGVNAILPITLTEFRAVPMSGSIKLVWETAEERNNDYMAVERSADARNFREIGRVKGVGNSTELQHYELIDTKPQAGINYYRLRQVDYDGTENYSKIIAVKNGRGTGKLVLSPNPAGVSLQLQTTEASAEERRYSVFDAAGRLALEGVFPSESTFETLEVTALPAGLYTLRLVNGNEVLAEKFYKE